MIGTFLLTVGFLILVCVISAVRITRLETTLEDLEHKIDILVREQNIIFSVSRDTIIFSLVTHGYSVERAEEIASIIHALKDVHELHRVWR